MNWLIEAYNLTQYDWGAPVAQTTSYSDTTGTVDTTTIQRFSATATAETVVSQLHCRKRRHCGTLLHVLERQLII